MHGVLPQTAIFTSVWLIVLTSVERTIAVLYPFRVHSIFSRFRCNLLIASLVVFFFTLSSTVSVCMEHNKSKPHFCQIKGSENGTCFYYYMFIFPWIRSSMGSWVPSLLGVSLNVTMIRALIKATRARKKISGEQMNHMNNRRRATIDSNNVNQSHNHANNIAEYELFIEKCEKDEANKDHSEYTDHFC